MVFDDDCWTEDRPYKAPQREDPLQLVDPPGGRGFPPDVQDLLDRKVMYTDPTTGAMKERGYVRMDLIPAIPQMLLGAVYGMGAEKYDDHNWRKGYPWSLSIAAAARHWERFVGGEWEDPESGLPHLAHLLWHANTLIEFRYTHPELDDRWLN